MRQLLSVDEQGFRSLCGDLGLDFKEFYSQEEAGRLVSYHRASTEHQASASNQPIATNQPTNHQPTANQLATQLVGGEVEQLMGLVAQVEVGAQQIAQEAGQQIAGLMGDIPRSALAIALDLTSQNQGFLYTASDAALEVGAAADSFRQQLSQRPRQLPSTAPTPSRQLRPASASLAGA
jgi:hypothetical protein